MKHTFILICVILCSLQTMATNLVLEQRSGAEVLKDIAIIGQWVFVEDTIQLLDKSGNILATEPIADIKKSNSPPTERMQMSTIRSFILLLYIPTQHKTYS